MATPPGGGGYSVPPSAPLAPSAPPAPSPYQGQQAWQQPNYNSAPTSYSSAPPSLSYSQSMRAQYNTQGSFGAGHPPAAAAYGDPQSVNTSYGQTPNTYGQAHPQAPTGYNQAQLPQGPASYSDPSRLISAYGTQSSSNYGPPSAYGQPGLPVSYAQQTTGYGQQTQPSAYGKPGPQAVSYGQSPTSQPTSYGHTPASQPTSYGQTQTSQYPQSYAQPGQYSSAAGYPASYGAPYGQTYNQTVKPKLQFPAGTDQEVVKSFELGDIDGSGFIDAAELGRVLSTGLPFSMRTVHLMLHLYSSTGSSKIGPTEFVALWKALKDWKACFERFDRDRSGRIDSQELRDALLSVGYSISPTLLQILISKYDRTGQAKAMDYDNFVECGLVVKGLTDRFKAKDTRFTGSATLDYESFMQMVLPFIVA